MESSSCSSDKASSAGGVESSQVGLSPGYWSYVPMCIAQIHTLRLVDGVNCWRVLSDQGNAFKLVPVSRCRLVGCIVSVQHKTNGSAHYVIDDGSGLLDCIAWEDYSYEDSLPSLIDHDDDTQDDCQVGDIVQVMGRLELCSGCLWELHVSFLQSLSRCPSRRAAPSCLDAESRHMLRRTAEPLASEEESCSSPVRLFNATDVLGWLGPDIASQVHQRQHFPSVEDTTGAWRLFGARCRCETRVKNDLLYCHCIATPEETDPEFKYRDALLDLFLDMESRRGGHDKNPLFVQFQEIASDQCLEGIAQRQVVELNRPAVHAKQLQLRTIRALRQDGILHLYNVASDTYLLISRSNVLEPYTRLLYSKDWEDSIVRAKLQKNKPDFLDKVPKARLQLVWRALKENENTNGKAH
jgi:hypothetical protein